VLVQVYRTNALRLLKLTLDHADEHG